MKIANMKFYGGARDKVCRLGLAHLFLELQEILISTEIRVLNEKHANGAAVVREMLDESFESAGEWRKTTSGGIDWVKRLRYNESIVSRIGVEVQVSGRSDLLARDIIHIRNELHSGHVDIGVIVVPSDELGRLLTDRVATFSYAVRYAEEELKEAQTYPIVLIAVEHDGLSDTPIPKKRTNRGRE